MSGIRIKDKICSAVSTTHDPSPQVFPAYPLPSTWSSWSKLLSLFSSRAFYPKSVHPKQLWIASKFSQKTNDVLTTTLLSSKFILSCWAHLPHNGNFPGIQPWSEVTWRMYSFPSWNHPQKFKLCPPNYSGSLSNQITDSFQSIWTLYWLQCSWSQVTGNPGSSWFTQ